MTTIGLIGVKIFKMRHPPLISTKKVISRPITGKVKLKVKVDLYSASLRTTLRHSGIPAFSFPAEPCPQFKDQRKLLPTKIMGYMPPRLIPMDSASTIQKLSKQSHLLKTQNLLVIVNKLKEFREFLEMTFLNHAISLVNDDIAYLCHLAQMFIALQHNHKRCYLDNTVLSP